MTEFENNLQESFDLTLQIKKNIHARQKWRNRYLSHIVYFKDLMEKTKEEINYLLYHSFSNKNTKELTVAEFAESEKGIKEAESYYRFIINNEIDGIHIPRQRSIDFSYIYYIDKQNANIYVHLHESAKKIIDGPYESLRKDLYNLTKISLVSDKYKWKDGMLEKYLYFIDKYRRINSYKRYDTLYLEKRYQNETYILRIPDKVSFKIEKKTKNDTIDIFDSDSIFDDDVAFNEMHYLSNRNSRNSIERKHVKTANLERLLLLWDKEAQIVQEQYENLYKEVYELTQPLRVLDKLKQKE